MSKKNATTVKKKSRSCRVFGNLKVVVRPEQTCMTGRKQVAKATAGDTLLLVGNAAAPLPRPRRDLYGVCRQQHRLMSLQDPRSGLTSTRRVALAYGYSYGDFTSLLVHFGLLQTGSRGLLQPGAACGGGLCMVNRVERHCSRNGTVTYVNRTGWTRRGLMLLHAILEINGINLYIF